MGFTAASTAVTWPALREELRLHPGPVDRDGQPSWTLQDPVRHRFLRIDWITVEILRRWWLGDPGLIASEIGRQTTLALDRQDVLDVLALAMREELVHPPRTTRADHASASPPNGSAKGLGWLLHHYLFFRIPLCRPDRALARLLPWLAWLGHPVFTRLTLLVLCAGLFGVLQQTERFGAQWLDLLSWRSLLLYGTTLVLIKVAHELGHALVARHHGCRVPTMGVAFMVLWPVAYTDTTEAWRLADRRARLQIAAAGVRTELTLAAWATLAWAVLPDGEPRTAAFVVATMTWLSSLFVNLNPFMRFDGYFLLCDALDMPNLHERAFAMGRWWLRRVVLGWESGLPEEDLSARRRRALVVFALMTWAYRVVLYLGIAWTVYHFGFKALGVVLFAVELGWFVVGPVWREIRRWWAGRAQWAGRRGVVRGAAWLLGGLSAGFVPWSSSMPTAAVLQPAQQLVLRLPTVAWIDQVPFQVGQSVRQGEVLLRASTQSLQHQVQLAQDRAQRVEQEVATSVLNPERQGQWSSLRAALSTAREQADSVGQELLRLQPVAPFAGVVVEVHPELTAGNLSPPPRETLLRVVNPDQWRVVAYAEERIAHTLRSGMQATVGVDAAPAHRWQAHVVSVAPYPAGQLAEPLLARANGGLVEAREIPSGWRPVEALYRVELALDEPPGLGLRQWRGHVVFASPPASTWVRLWSLAAVAAVREGGF